MSKKKVLDYDPKTGFGNFAEIMNKNYALDMARNGVNMPANNMAGAPLESGTLGGTQAQSGMLKVDTAAPSLAEAVGVTEDPVVTDTETGTVTGTDASTGADAGAVSGVTSDLTGSTAQPILSVPGYKSDMGTYDEWMAKNGYDPDRDYDEKKAALEYDYETRMATYGRRAEELSQMGLSNSGLSDIYQLGAFNSYLQQQNQIANERIAARKKYKQEYNALYQQNQDALKLDNANAYNLGLSLYDGENIDFVRQQLTQQGYDASVVEQAVQSLAALDVNTLPVVKEQLAANEADINEAAAKLAESYTAENEAGIRQLYTEWANVMMPNGKTKLDALIEKLNGYVSAFAPSEDELVSEGAVVFGEIYDGTEFSKNQIEQMLELPEYSKYKNVYYKIIKRMEENKNKATVARTNDLKKALGISGEDTTLTANDIEQAFKDGYKLVGMSQEKWNDMDEADKTLALIHQVGEETKSGNITSTDAAEIYNRWIQETSDYIWSLDGEERPDAYDDFIEQLEEMVELGYIDDAAGAINAFKEAKNADVDYGIRKMIHVVGTNLAANTVSAFLGPLWLVGVAHNVAKGIKNAVTEDTETEAEKKAKENRKKNAPTIADVTVK
jgi:hypothetical protein